MDKVRGDKGQRDDKMILLSFFLFFLLLAPLAYDHWAVSESHTKPLLCMSNSCPVIICEYFCEAAREREREREREKREEKRKSFSYVTFSSSNCDEKGIRYCALILSICRLLSSDELCCICLLFVCLFVCFIHSLTHSFSNNLCF